MNLGDLHFFSLFGLIGCVAHAVPLGGGNHLRHLAFVEVLSFPHELGILHLLEVAAQTCLSSCPLPGADAGPVSSYTYMIRGLGVGIG